MTKNGPLVDEGPIKTSQIEAICNVKFAAHSALLCRLADMDMKGDLEPTLTCSKVLASRLKLSWVGKLGQQLWLDVINRRDLQSIESTNTCSRCATKKVCGPPSFWSESLALQLQHDTAYVVSTGMTVQ